MLRFLVDESSGRRLASALAGAGHNIKFVTDIMPAAADLEILKFAEREKRILITNDKDFGELIFRLRKPSSGVILLRLQIDSAERRIKTVLSLIDKFLSQLYSHFVVANEFEVRIRKL